MMKNQLLMMGAAIAILAGTSSCRKNNSETLVETGNSIKEKQVGTLAIPVLTNTLLKSGFGNGTTVTISNPSGSQSGQISGGDISPYNWQTSIASQSPVTYFDAAKLNYEQGDLTKRGADIQNDPVLGASNKVLRYYLTQYNVTLSTGEKKGRVSYDLTNSNHPSTKVKEYSQKVRIFLSNSFSLLANSTLPAPGQWLTLFEFGDDVQNNLALSTASRISVNVVRKTDYTVGDSKLYWEAQFQEHNPNWADASWGRKRNTTIAIPIGQWFTVELYIKQGIGSNGRFTMIMNGNTVFDQTGTNVSSLFASQGTQPDGQEGWNPMKMYCAKTVIDLFQNASGGAQTMTMFWDDIDIKYKP